MKKIFTLLLVVFSMQLFSQTSARVTITVEASIQDVLDACQEAGKKINLGAEIIILKKEP